MVSGLLFKRTAYAEPPPDRIRYVFIAGRNKAGLDRELFRTCPIGTKKADTEVSAALKPFLRKAI